MNNSTKPKWDNRFPDGRPPKWLVDANPGLYPEWEIDPETTINCGAEPSLEWVRNISNIGERSSVDEHLKMDPLVWSPALGELYHSNRLIAGDRINGHDLLRELASRSVLERAGRPVLNANVMEWLLTHPDKIPEYWKWWARRVFFFGTVYRDSSGDKFVRFMRRSEGHWNGQRWVEGHWIWDYEWLGNDALTRQDAVAVLGRKR